MMRIAIDARELAGHPTGVGRYLGEILRAWEAMPEARGQEFVFCAPAAIPYEGQLRVTHAVGAGSGTGWEQRVLPELARHAAADVLFCPAYSGPIFDTTPLVIALHDVSFFAHPEWFRWREGLRRRMVTRASARRAARVLTLTDFSKREIIEHVGIDPARIEVIRPGVTRLNQRAPQRRDDERDPSILYVGSIFNRRHVPETIAAVERLAKRRPAVRLTIVGDNRTFPHVDLNALVHDRERIQLLPYAPDEVLAALQERARAFVFLSEYEGFGLTPAEALAAGIPIVVLDTPVAREVYGDAAIYVGEPNPHLIAPALERALFDDDERSRVLAAAPAVLGRVSWAECGRRVLQALLDAGR